MAAISLRFLAARIWKFLAAGWQSKKRIKTSYVFTEPNAQRLDQLTKLIESEQLKPVVTKRLPLTLEGVKEGHTWSQTERVRGKIVLQREEGV